ncbi:hypothetical protein A3I99_00990 [Candidatus Kaiserbacteria bacterium RIFCSPLOWO2_02_FULL_45_11b]|uniref:Uncharacterized protein n=1 Tax=Candidatus Kaiserbacteria bacterium RIFCSPLOWO2_12_FULL_45_26 TaxID=1798525 RepID=A0A1F6FFK7_9BACT|nr:MAG: hypothetical protein A2Z56_04905 [Candidatus Kaiserbacteria bacterium RIFCSPHIGHO2_12_45_16]OGG69505.1 MAG: hypothetical protein A2929_02965 [Candidatus Kaiserbacteria bacterium RIFCSPLOWO2_01_FULL_45_25]OGG80898.1 MAG: hypothetical protein A3I99_00990 [Candidatus Kaiserbacteria bacterium RIFCSPLOWO2_02_FULL_45_11b]OGG84635.1 MAG: hypothetical protein A3G90_00935 [Candidatus Kaiserbacteria bacterium RIFCSPLOWO2_12_FULL_45_26]
MSNHGATNKEGKPTSVNISGLPDECPICHNKGTFSPISLFHNSNRPDSERELEVIFRCPNSKCHDCFIGYYKINRHTGHFDLLKTAPKQIKSKDFSDIITLLSPEFVSIYNQAKSAEDSGLDKICGVGYRKALEFLLKDFLISKTSDEGEQEAIKNEFLGTTISKRIDSTKIKEIAKRATWLGNDETHYTKKWDGKDLTDLKLTLELTVHWIEAELLTEKILNEMPEAQK